LAFYERKDRNLQRKRDSLLIVLEDKTENARIAYYQQGQDFQQRQFDVMMELVKMKNGNGETATERKGGESTTYAPRPPYQNRNSSNMMMILILIILLGGFVGIFFAIKQKPKPVYLKPKTKEKNKDAKEETVPKAPLAQQTPDNNENRTPSQNNDILKSEVKSLRQSAVSMSVGQKEAATKILQDWLDEPSQENNQDESEKEEQE
jgi:flagellar basal body-associated protein FliL